MVPIMTQIKMMSYNIGFCGGDTGLRDGVQSHPNVARRLSEIMHYITLSNADVVAVQEVDVRSRRSAYINQRQVLTQVADYQYSDWVDTWRHPWVPYPVTINWRRHFGPVHAGQLLLSRYPICDRRQVPLIQRQDRPGIYNWFYLHAQYHEICIQVPVGRLWIGHCHLDAFDQKTRSAQAQQIIDHWHQNGVPDVVIGDWNCTPSERLVTGCIERGFYVTVGDALWDFPGHHPTEQLSYVAHRSQWQSEAWVNPAILASDHLPLHCDITIGL